MAVDVSKHLDRAKRFLEKNRVEDAIAAYKAVLDEAPQHQEATQALGDLYARAATRVTDWAARDGFSAGARGLRRVRGGVRGGPAFGSGGR